MIDSTECATDHDGAWCWQRCSTRSVGTRVAHPDDPLMSRSGPARQAWGMTDTTDDMVSVRYIVDDVQAAIDFYTGHLGFALQSAHPPAFADVTRGRLRLLLSGPESSGARATPPDAAVAGRNRIHLSVDDLDAEIDRLRSAGLTFRSEVVSGPGGRQVLVADPAGNLVELFTPAGSG